MGDVKPYFWLSEDPKEREAGMLARLREARYCLVSELRSGFGKGEFNPVSQTLVGDNGVILQWRSRPKPHLPESYENQQTNLGSVRVCGSWPLG